METSVAQSVLNVYQFAFLYFMTFMFLDSLRLMLGQIDFKRFWQDFGIAVGSAVICAVLHEFVL